MYSVAITGASGKSGQYFLKRLLKERDALKGYRFVLLCRIQEKNSKNVEGYQIIQSILKDRDLQVELFEVDITNEEKLSNFFEKEHIDMLLHIAGVKLSKYVVPATLKGGVDNFILVHTTGIYSKYKVAGEEYRQIEAELHKLVGEYRNKGRKVAMTILRPTMIYGDLQDKNVSVFIKMVDKLRIFPTVNGARYDLQPVWCKDLGDAYYDVMMKWDITQNKEYILSGKEPIQLREMFEVMAKQLGVKNIFISCPYPIAYAGAWVIYLISLKKIDMREKVQRLVEPRAYSHEKATKDFGYNPVEFEVGVQEEIKRYQECVKK